MLIFVTIRLAVDEMPEGDVLLATVRHDILAELIRQQRPLPHPAWHSILAVGSDAAVVNPAGIRIMRAGIDDRDLAGLPIRDVDQQLGAAAHI